MTKEEIDYLKSCNGMGDIGNGTWLPYRRDGANYYTPRGLSALAPRSFRPLTPAEIVAEMEADGAVPVINW